MDFKNSQHCAELLKVSLFASNAMSFLFFYCDCQRDIRIQLRPVPHLTITIYIHSHLFKYWLHLVKWLSVFLNGFLFHCAVLLTQSYIKIQSNTTSLI